MQLVTQNTICQSARVARQRANCRKCVKSGRVSASLKGIETTPVYRVRRWAARHARFFESFYVAFEAVLIFLHPLLRRIGYRRLERPVAAMEKLAKGFLFDTQMCGSCTLSATGMVCPMNCPKTMRNGPCGGVRSNGHCEVKPEMKCVWADAYAGSLLMRHGDRIREQQPALDNRLKGSSSWLREVRRKTGSAEPGDMAQ